MTKITESVTTLLKSPFKGGGTISDRVTRSTRAGKDVVRAGQKYDPVSKYVGYSMVPGVDSRKEINQKVAEDKKAETAAAAAADEEKKKPKPMPPSAISDERSEKRKAARRSGGRISTILSDTLG